MADTAMIAVMAPTDAEAERALASALTAARDALIAGRERPRGGELALADELLTELVRAVPRVTMASDGGAPEDRQDVAAPLACGLVGFAGDDAGRRATLADLAAAAARQMAPAGDPPADGAAGVVWQVLVHVIGQLGGGPGVYRLGSLPFLGATRLNALLDEATDALAGTAQESGREQWGAPAGPLLARLAVSRQLRDAVSEAVGYPVVPTYKAVYLADPPGSLVRSHIDKRGYDLTFHLVLEHHVPDDKAGSPLLVHRAGATGPQHLWLRPGEAVVLRARATLHGWGRLDPAESRTMIGVGFVPAPSTPR